MGLTNGAAEHNRPAVARASSEFPTPLPNRLVGDNDPAFGQKIFDITEAQAEPIVVPDGVTDDFGWESVSVIGGSMAFHRFSLLAAPQLDNTPRTKIKIPRPSSSHSVTLPAIVASRSWTSTSTLASAERKNADQSRIG